MIGLFEFMWVASGPMILAGFCGTKTGQRFSLKTKVLMWIFVSLGALLDFVKMI